MLISPIFIESKVYSEKKGRNKGAFLDGFFCVTRDTVKQAIHKPRSDHRNKSDPYLNIKKKSVF